MYLFKLIYVTKFYSKGGNVCKNSKYYLFRYSQNILWRNFIIK